MVCEMLLFLLLVFSRVKSLVRSLEISFEFVIISMSRWPFCHQLSYFIRTWDLHGVVLACTPSEGVM